MATIDNTGASVKTLQQYKQDIEAAYLAIDAAWNIEPESLDGQAIGIWSELFANLDEAVIAAYQSIDPRVAVAQQLDRIAALNLLTRQEGTFSTATVDLTGTAGTVVPAGTEFRNSETDTLWASDASVTLTGGTGTVNVTCTTSGPEPAGVGQINEIGDAVAGLSSVTNPDAAALGDAKESDLLFRLRRAESVGKPGNNQVDSMFAEVANVTGVNRVKIYENFEAVTDANDLNPHSLAIIVDGGSNADIASAIAAKKNPGCNLNAGNASIENEQTEATTTPAGNPLTATFFRPDLTTIYVEVTIDGPFVEADIKEAIIQYASGELLGEGTGFDRTGFGIGDSVPSGKLYTPVNRVLGDTAFADSILIGTSPGPTTGATVPIPFNGLAVFSEAEITVVSA